MAKSDNIQKTNSYLRGLFSLLNVAMDVAIKVVGIFGLLYGLSIIWRYFTNEASRKELVDYPTAILIYGALAFLVAFIGAFIYYTIMFFKKNGKLKITGYEKDKERIDKNQNQLEIPEMRINIDSRDQRYMDSNQIKSQLKGTKQVLIEYRKLLKEVQKGNKLNQE